MNAEEFLRRTLFRLHGRVIHLKPAGQKKGAVLISYIALPYLNRSPQALSAHTNRWESAMIGEIFQNRGYAVDLIDITNTRFLPGKKYDFFIDNGTNLERLDSMLGPDCKKIFHATTAHWKFNNDAEQKRFDNLFERKGVRLAPDRLLPPNRAAEVCDMITLLGNNVTEGTYAYSNKPITKIPISTTHLFKSPEHKDFEAARKHFIWFGGAGAVHKGLDLVVEAFKDMPDYTLTICGKLDGELDFKRIYERELSLPNIHMRGFIDPGSDEFKTLCEHALGLVYPSCSEGQAGAVVLCMHAGLIPIISAQSGVDIGDFGTILAENSVPQIQQQIRAWSTAPTHTLKESAAGAWHDARERYTRDTFKRAYEAFADTLLA